MRRQNARVAPFHMSRGLGMRPFLLFFGVLIAALWAFDTAMFRGRNTDAAVQEAKYQGQQFNRKIGSLLREYGISR